MWKREKQALIEAGFSGGREGANWKVEGMEIFLERASIIQCFCHAKDNIQ